MANYNLVINSKFKPFSYQEMLHPIAMATEAHQAVENEYADLATKASIWDGLANEQTDPIAYKRYKDFANNLSQQAEELSKNGLSSSSRQNMLKMRERYASDIIPIEQAYARRKEFIDEQRKLMAQDNTIMFDKDANLMSLDSLLDNPNMSYTPYSGAALTKQVATAVQNLAKQYRENPRQWRSILGGQYWETMERRGYSPEQIIAAAANDPNAPQELKNIVEDAVQSSPIASWGDKEKLDRAYKHAREGLWYGIGEDRYDTLANRGYNIQPTKSDVAQESVASLFAPRITTGVGGEVNKTLRRFEGLRPTENGGASTKNLDKLYSDKIKAEEALNRFEASNDMNSIKLFESSNNYSNIPTGNNAYAKLGAGMARNISTPKNYNLYKKLKDDVVKYNNKYNEEAQELDRLAEKYKHLGNTFYESVALGVALENTQQKTLNSHLPMNLEKNELGKASRGVINLFLGTSEDVMNKGGAGLEDSNGKVLSAKKFKELRDDKDFENKATIKVKVDDGKPSLVLTYDQKDYNLKGLNEVEAYNRELSQVDTYLKDFSKNALSNPVEIDSREYSNIMQSIYSGNGVGNINTPIPAGSVKDLNNGYSSIVFHNNETGDFVKVLIDNNNNYVAANSLNSELSGGELRDREFLNRASEALNFIPDLVAAKRQKH